MEAPTYRSPELPRRDGLRYAPVWRTLQRRRTIASVLRLAILPVLGLFGLASLTMHGSALGAVYLASFPVVWSARMFGALAVRLVGCPRCAKRSAFVARTREPSRCGRCHLPVGELSPMEREERAEIERTRAALSVTN
jgi:hypothetical protein